MRSFISITTSSFFFSTFFGTTTILWMIAHLPNLSSAAVVVPVDGFTRRGGGGGGGQQLRRAVTTAGLFPGIDASNQKDQDAGGAPVPDDASATAPVIVSHPPPQIHDPYSSTLQSDMVDKLNGFGLRLFSNLASSTDDDGAAENNIVISPTSIATALTMISLGTTVDSQAELEVLELFGGEHGFASSPSSSSSEDETNTTITTDDVTIQVANAIWSTQYVLESYRDTIETTMDAQIFPEEPNDDVSEINSWVNTATNGTISTIIDTIPSNLVAILINAVFFKAPWTTRFDIDDTLVDEPFYGSHGGEEDAYEEDEEGPFLKSVAMMQLKKQTFPYGVMTIQKKTTTTDDGNGDGDNDVDVVVEEGNVQMVELSYGKQEEYSSTFLVPNGPDITLDDVISQLIAGDDDGEEDTTTSTMMMSQVWNDWVGIMVPTELDLVAVPRFTIEYGVKELKGVLQTMGMKTVFESNATSPPLGRMTNDTLTYLDNVLHRSTLECTEEGTTASAVTAAIVMTRSFTTEKKLPKVILNRPFLMVIRNRVSGAILFIAKVVDPTAMSSGGSSTGVPTTTDERPTLFAKPQEGGQ